MRESNQREQRPRKDLSQIKVHYGRVQRTQRLTPLMQRVTLGELDVPAFESIGPEQFVYVFFPKPGERDQPPVDHSFTWDSVRGLPREQWPVGRYYTVRQHRATDGEFDLDMVLHGDGPGAAFAHEAKPGDAVSF